MAFSQTTVPPIEFSGVDIAFGDHRVVSGFSLTLQPGEFLVLGGDSGAGKSTLLQAVMGFVPLQSGEIRVMGETLTASSVWRLRRHLAYVPQEAQPGNDMTAEAFLQRPFSFRANAGQSYPRQRTLELFDAFRLPTRLLTESVGALSGGEKQRVAIIGAILLNRPIYILDEITSALDEESTRAVTRWFADQTDAAVLAVAHDAVFREAAGRVVRLPGNGTGATP